MALALPVARIPGGPNRPCLWRSATFSPTYSYAHHSGTAGPRAAPGAHGTGPAGGRQGVVSGTLAAEPTTPMPSAPPAPRPAPMALALPVAFRSL